MFLKLQPHGAVLSFIFSVVAFSVILSLGLELAVFVHWRHEVPWVLRRFRRGSSYAATAAASPRVDVEKTPQAAAAPQVSARFFKSRFGLSFGGLLGPGEQFQGGGRRKTRSWEVGESGLFLRLLCPWAGSTVQVRVEGTDSYENLAAKVAAKVNIPERHWYLTFWCRDLRHVLCPTSVLQRDSTVRMHSRLLGGAPLQPTPGEWFCPACNRGGCWASRRTCFRCLAPRPARGSTPLQPQSRGAQLEGKACFVGREPLRSPTQCPTERRVTCSTQCCQWPRWLEPPLPTAIGGSLSLLPIARTPLRSLNCSRG